MVNYASTIGELNDDENVLVLYGAEPQQRSSVSFRPGRVVVKSGNPDRMVVNDDETEDEADAKPEIPIISMSVKKSDPETLRESLENRIHLIRELMIDYGSTLSTLNDEHSLLLSIHISGQRDSDLPDRIDLRITNADLQAMEQGAISREQAMDRIIERRN